MRFIDADTLFEYIQKEKAWKQDTISLPRYDKGKYDAYYEMLEIIKKQPTIEAKSVIHAHWIFDSDGYARCSICNQKAPVFLQYQDEPETILSHYCPSCDAIMDEKKTEE